MIPEELLALESLEAIVGGIAHCQSPTIAIKIQPIEEINRLHPKIYEICEKRKLLVDHPNGKRIAPCADRIQKFNDCCTAPGTSAQDFMLELGCPRVGEEFCVVLRALLIR